MVQIIEIAALTQMCPDDAWIGAEESQSSAIKYASSPIPNISWGVSMNSGMGFCS